MDKIINIIQGDTVEMGIIDDTDLLAEAQFICEDLKIYKDLVFSPDLKTWTLRLEKEETAQLRAGVFQFKVVAVFKEGFKKTVIYGQKVNVLLKDY